MPERLRLCSDNQFARLVLTHVGDEAGAVAVDVELRADAFAVPFVWFQRGTLDTFGEALVRFERERSGSVAVSDLGEAAAASAFSMTLSASPGGGPSVAVSILRVRYARSRYAPLELTARFDVDGGDIGAFVRGWQGLFSERA